MPEPRRREAEETAHRWHWRGTASRWFTVEYDMHGRAWLVASAEDRICLEAGMQVDVARIAWIGPPTQRTRPVKKKGRRDA